MGPPVTGCRPATSLGSENRNACKDPACGRRTWPFGQRHLDAFRSARLVHERARRAADRTVQPPLCTGYRNGLRGQWRVSWIERQQRTARGSFCDQRGYVATVPHAHPCLGLVYAWASKRRCPSFLGTHRGCRHVGTWRFTCLASCQRRSVMLKSLLHRYVRTFERNFGYDASYMHDVIDASPSALLKFSFVQFMAQHRQEVSADAWHAAHVAGALSEDCGPCVQI